jgi:hypothetical protein
MSQHRGTNRTGNILVWKVLPIKGKAFWVKQNPLGMAQIIIAEATANALIAAGATKLDDHQIVKSGREVTINL